MAEGNIERQISVINEVSFATDADLTTVGDGDVPCSRVVDAAGCRAVACWGDDPAVCRGINSALRQSIIKELRRSFVIITDWFSIATSR